MKPISLLAISDVHIGCPRINPHLLHDRLIKYVYPRITKDISILFVCGDFFDTLLNLNAAAAFEAMYIIRELKSLCVQNGCDLRVLRGTFTHDRIQPRHFINGEDPNNSAVKLFDTMSVEYHEKTGLHILYMPDNIVSKDIYEDIRKLLEAHHLEKVDILVHHGYFTHMLPEALLVKGMPNGCLEVDKIQKFVKGCVLNGHVHLSGIYKNVISVGSFDRMSHGEEGPKGFYQINIGETGDYRFEFIKNEDATKFLTYDLRSETASDAAIETFKSKINELKSKIEENVPLHIRIISDDREVIDACSTLAKEVIPWIIVDQYNSAKRTQTIENVPINLEELPRITPENLLDLVMPIIRKKDPSADPDKMKKILDICANKEHTS